MFGACNEVLLCEEADQAHLLRVFDEDEPVASPFLQAGQGRTVRELKLCGVCVQDCVGLSVECGSKI